MKLKPFKLVPGLIAVGVIGLCCVLRWAQVGFLERLELISYDMRVRAALRVSPTVATNLGFVAIDEDSLRVVRDGSLGYSYGLLWPRQVYGRLVEELRAQGAKAVALDVIFDELRPDQPPVQMASGPPVESDEFFAIQMRRAGNVIVALTKDVTPPAWFVTNACAVGDITTEKDADGVLRRVQIYRTYTNWHAAFREAHDKSGFNLNEARVEPDKIILHSRDEVLTVPLDREGNFSVAASEPEKNPPGTPAKARPFTLEPLWHMGVVLAARELGLDLAKADIELHRGRIVLHGAGGLQRTIPVDANGYAYVDWGLPPNDPHLTQQAIQDLLLEDTLRLKGQAAALTNLWQGKLAVVGSSGLIGNNLTDRGATPFSKDTLLVSKHWNVANSIIMGRFVHRSSLALDLTLIVLLGLLSAVLSWELPVLRASGTVILLAAAYIAFATFLYVQSRLWLPIVLPVVGALLMNYVCLVTWRVVFEQTERRRVRAVLATVVSPKIAHVLLQSEKLSLGGARREITVLFADVRGFTEFTDSSQDRVAEHVARHGLTGDAAEACFDEAARETLGTVNLYLGLVADTILNQDGTLDKFIGDCVMAFWGAPIAEPKHALACVRAAIGAQRAVDHLNQTRSAENQRRELENRARASAGLPEKPLFPLLLLGTGINTGMATVGMMGSEVQTVVRQGNYTVFGREVNLASRLEGLSGRGRIFISEATYKHLLRDDPALAATCVARAPEKVKGISASVKVYEVPWRTADPLPAPEPPPVAPGRETAAVAE